MSGTEEIPASNPFFNPSTTLLPISDQSIFLKFSINSWTLGIFSIASTKSVNASTAILTPEPSASNPLFTKSLLNKKSLNATAASPIPAVTSSKSKSKALRTAFKPRKANLAVPPATVEIMSNIAKTPLNVLSSLPRVSSVGIKDAVKL